MLDFIFRRGNPSNDWVRSRALELSVNLDVPSINEVRLGDRCDRLSFLGRSDDPGRHMLTYADLGLRFEIGGDGLLKSFNLFFQDVYNELQTASKGFFQPYAGRILWNQQDLNATELQEQSLEETFGQSYWTDQDDDESIAFYEFPEYEMQIELDLTGTIKVIRLTSDPLMADEKQRESYNVDKPWPPAS